MDIFDSNFSFFNPDGTLSQINIINESLKNSKLMIGLRSNNHAVIVTEKSFESSEYISTLVKLDSHIGIAISGSSSQIPNLIEMCKSECINYKLNYGIPIPMKVLNSKLSNHLHLHTISKTTKPLELNAICISYNEKLQNGVHEFQDGALELQYGGPTLYGINCSGESYGYYGIFYGRNSSISSEHCYNSSFLYNLNLLELINHAITLIYYANDNRRSEINLGYIGKDTKGIFEIANQQIIEQSHQIIQQNYKF